MAIRYSQETLLFLRDSPLCVKPDHLPPVEEWMGATPEQLRAQQNKVVANDRPRTGDNSLPDQTNRRPGLERHASRNTANPEDIVFAPPQMAFASSRGNSKVLENEKSWKDLDVSSRFNNFRERVIGGEIKGDHHRRVGDGERDQDSDGWRMVKGRKSFGAEGAERFHGKMGGNFRDERRPTRDKDDREPAMKDRPLRAPDTTSHERDDLEDDDRHRTGPGRIKLDVWRADGKPDNASAADRRRDRNKSWRDRDENEAGDRVVNKTQDRRWGRERDQRGEREPEWMDEPVLKPKEAHTQQDFQKWMEQMKRAKGAADGKIDAVPGKPIPSEPVEAIVEAEQPPARATPMVEIGPDKFFMAFGGSVQGLDAAASVEQKEMAPKPKAAGKSSRFTSFFSPPPQDEARGRPEPPLPTLGLGAGGLLAALNGPMATLAAATDTKAPQAPDDERQAFQQLLAKLQKQGMSGTPPAASLFAAPPNGPGLDLGKKSAVTSPEPFQQYGDERRAGLIGQPPSQSLRDSLGLQPQSQPQQQSARPEQLLQDLVGHHQRTTSQGSGRVDPGAVRNNSNTEFLMNLMRAGPGSEPQRLTPGQQHLKQNQMAQMSDREAEFQRRVAVDSRHLSQPPQQQGLPRFPTDERFHVPEHDLRPQQPTQILQRPPPPGLDQMSLNWVAAGGQGQMQPPPQNRGQMLPPPGLGGGGALNRPPPHMFPPNFSPRGIMSPDGSGLMGGIPSRNMPPPPPGFFGGPHHGFMPPTIGGFNGPPGITSPGEFAGSPFDGRGGGMPPGGGRGANFGRP